VQYFRRARQYKRRESLPGIRVILFKIRRSNICRLNLPALSLVRFNVPVGATLAISDGHVNFRAKEVRCLTNTSASGFLPVLGRPTPMGTRESDGCVRNASTESDDVTSSFGPRSTHRSQNKGRTTLARRFQTEFLPIASPE